MKLGIIDYFGIVSLPKRVLVSRILSYLVVTLLLIPLCLDCVLLFGLAEYITSPYISEKLLLIGLEFHLECVVCFLFLQVGDDTRRERYRTHDCSIKQIYPLLRIVETLVVFEKGYSFRLFGLVFSTEDLFIVVFIKLVHSFITIPFEFGLTFLLFFSLGILD